MIIHNCVFYDNSDYIRLSQIGFIMLPGPGAAACSYCRTVSTNDKPCANCGAPR